MIGFGLQCRRAVQGSCRERLLRRPGGAQAAIRSWGGHMECRSYPLHPAIRRSSFLGRYVSLRPAAWRRQPHGDANAIIPLLTCHGCSVFFLPWFWFWFWFYQRTRMAYLMLFCEVILTSHLIPGLPYRIAQKIWSRRCCAKIPRSGLLLLKFWVSIRYRYHQTRPFPPSIHCQSWFYWLGCCSSCQCALQIYYLLMYKSFLCCLCNWAFVLALFAYSVSI